MANDHSNPPSLGYVRLPGPRATVCEMATAAARRCAQQDQQDQYRFMVRAVGHDILDGLPAFYLADGSLAQLTPDHRSQLGAYLEGKTTRTEVEAGRSFVLDRPTYHQKEAAFNGDWIKRAIIKKTDYAELLISRGEPLPGWWFTSTEVAKAETSDSPFIGWEGFNQDSDTYPPELDFAMQAWRAVTNGPDPSKTPKEQVQDWLKHHYPNLSEGARKRIAVVCNWEKSGGRPAK